MCINSLTAPRERHNFNLRFTDTSGSGKYTSGDRFAFFAARFSPSMAMAVATALVVCTIAADRGTTRLPDLRDRTSELYPTSVFSLAYSVQFQHYKNCERLSAC